MTEAVVGVDIGTSGVKVGAFDRSGATVAKASEAYSIHRDSDGFAEQDPNEIVSATVEALRTASRGVSEGDSKVAAVVVTTAMHGLMALDAEGAPLTRLIIWSDRRAATEAEGVRSSPDGIRVFQRTGTPVHPMSPFTKLLWFRNHDRDTLRKAARWISIKEFLFMRLLERLVTDRTSAATTGLWNLEEGRWDGVLLRMIGVGEQALPEVIDPLEVVGNIGPVGARYAGVDAGVPFFAGISDGTAANIGAGAVDPGTVVLSVGSSGAVRRMLSEPKLEAKGRMFCYPSLEDRWLVGAPFNSGGAVVRWVLENMLGLAPTAESYEELTRLAGRAPVGSRGLTFVPHLLGERAPQWDPSLRGVLAGLAVEHGPEHLARAALEGVAIQAHLAMRLLERTTGRAGTIRFTGGIGRSEFFTRLLADVMDRDIEVTRDHEGTAFGAALLGMLALGWVPDLAGAAKLVEVARRHRPDPGTAALYRDIVDRSQRVYSSLEGEWSGRPR